MSKFLNAGEISRSIGKPYERFYTEHMSEQHGDLTHALEEVEFTYEWYRGFLGHLDTTGARFRAYSEDIEAGDVLLRHDVDLSPARAVRIARIEADLGVHATYFFILSSPLYNVLNRHTREVIREIESMGHDVGLHFSTHQHWPEDATTGDGPDDRAVEHAVERERAALGTIADPIDTVSFHAPPEWVQGRQFDAFESAYAPEFFTDVAYLADSNQRWREDPPLSSGLPDRMQMLTHPGLWGEHDRSFEERVRAAADTSRELTERYAKLRYIEPARGGPT